MRDSGADKDLDRLIAFTDGTVTVALTLLVLDIRLPSEAGTLDDAGLLAAFLSIAPRYYAYALSFLVVGSFWLAHREKFRWIVKGDITLAWLNIVFLLFLCLIPFVTSLISDNPGRTATIAYAAAMGLASIMLGVLWLYATRAGLTASDLDPTVARRITLRSAWSLLVFALSIAVAWFDPTAGKLTWLLLLLRRFIPSAPKAAKPSPRSA